MTILGVLDGDGVFHAEAIPSCFEDRLALLVPGFLPLFVDFSTPALKRRKEAGKTQGLIRACQPAFGISILDTTAGWGRDAALLSHFGARVILLERHPIMGALLADGIRRKPPALALSLRTMDAKAYLTALSLDEYPDVIYIDPMHPLRQKSALVKKDMQVLQQLVGVDEDARELIALARGRAKRRVVVKWPQRLPALFPPSLCIEGTTVRFDVYTRDSSKVTQ